MSDRLMDVAPVPSGAADSVSVPSSSVRTAVVDGPRGAAATAVTAALASLGVTVLPAGQVPDLYCAVLVDGDVYGAAPAVPGLSRVAALAVARSMALRGGGRMVLLTDATAQVHSGGSAEHASRRAADLAWWQHLASRYAASGVQVNTVGVGYAPFLGHRLPRERAEEVLRHLALRRPVSFEDLVGVLRLFAGRGGRYLVGERIPLDGGADLNLIAVPRSAAGAGASPSRYRADPSSAQVTPGADTAAAPAGRRPVCLVVGASSGIGRAVALELGKAGHDLVVVGRRVEALRELTGRLADGGSGAWALPCDVADPGEARGLLERAVALAGRVDGVVYAAGLLSFGHTEHPASGPFAVNLFGYMAVCERVTEYWRRLGVRGSVVGISSVGSEWVPVTRVEEYGASKAAMVQYSRCLAATVARDGIRVNCVCPGIVRTRMGEMAGPDVRQGWVARIPAGRIGEPDDVAPVVTWLLGDTAAHVTGARLRVDGGYGLGGMPPLCGPGAGHGVRAGLEGAPVPCATADDPDCGDSPGRPEGGTR